MRSVLPWLIPVAMCATWPAPARAADPARIVAAKRTLERGVYAKTPETLVRARAEFQAMSAAEPKSALLHYWVAVTDWRLVPRLSEKKREAQRYLKEGLSHADRALELDPRMAEALAVKSSLQGLSIQFDSSIMMTLGPELEMNMQRALEADPENPRIHLLDAIGTLHKPEFVGGGADKALAKLIKTQELFAAESHADSTVPDWGREESYIWAGRSALALKDYEAARGFYQKALEINPGNGWVRHVLVPELEKAATAPAEGKSGS